MIDDCWQCDNHISDTCSRFFALSVVVFSKAITLTSQHFHGETCYTHCSHFTLYILQSKTVLFSGEEYSCTSLPYFIEKYIKCKYSLMLVRKRQNKYDYLEREKKRHELFEVATNVYLFHVCIPCVHLCICEVLFCIESKCHEHLPRERESCLHFEL